MILKGTGYFVKENEPWLKDGKEYLSCELESEDKKDRIKVNIPEPIKLDIKEAHYPKVEFSINQSIRNGKNGTFVINNLLELRRIK